MEYTIYIYRSGLLMEDVLNKIKMLGKYVERIDVRKVALDYGNPINQKATLVIYIYIYIYIHRKT